MKMKYKTTSILKKKSAVDERMVCNGKLRNEAISNGEDANEDDYTAACQELLKKMSEIKTKIEALLKSEDAGSILLSLVDNEQRVADARENSTR